MAAFCHFLKKLSALGRANARANHDKREKPNYDTVLPAYLHCLKNKFLRITMGLKSFFAVFIAISSSVQAATIYPVTPSQASYETVINGTTFDSSNPLPLTTESSNGGTASAQAGASVSNGNIPYLTATAQTTGGLNIAYAQEYYSFGVFGFQNIAVPVTVTGYMQTAASLLYQPDSPFSFFSQANSHADITIATSSSDGTVLFSDSVCSGAITACLSHPSVDSYSETFSVIPGQSYSIFLDAFADAGALFGYGVSSSAKNDPVFQIDPVFLTTHPGYTLEFSQGVANASLDTSSVPIPASMLLFSTAILAILAISAIGSTKHHMIQFQRRLLVMKI